MKRIIVGCVIALAIVGGLLSWRASAGSEKKAIADSPRGVTAVVAKDTEFRRAVRYVATVEPWLQSRVGPEVVSGFVDTVLVRPGDLVKKEQILATLDCRHTSAGGQALAMQARALEERQKAEASEASRIEGLASGGFVSSNELEQKQAQIRASSAQLEGMKAQLVGKDVEVRDCLLRAPFAGEIAERLLDPGAFARPGSTIVTVVDRHVLRVVGDAPEVDYAAVAKGVKARLHFLATDEHVDAVISRRAPSADVVSRTIRFEIDLDAGARDLPSGTTAEVSVDVGEPRAAREIPLTAAKLQGDVASFFLVQNDTAKAVRVKALGERGGSLFVSAEELQQGAVVVTEGARSLVDGAKVITKLSGAK